MSKVKKLKDKCIYYLKELIDLVFHRPIQAFKIFCFWVGFSFVSFLSITILVVFLFLNSLKSFDNLSFRDLKIEAVEIVSKKISKNMVKNFKYISLDKVNRDLIYPIVYSEDGKFFKHPGFDRNAILRSVITNFKNQEYTVGGSTITQQVVKNLYLSDSKSIIRKLKEIIIATRLESAYTKNEILELYLNIIEFGPDIYGVDHASQYYFKKSPESINPAEGAFLALLLPSPRKYHYALYENKNITKPKRNKLKRILSTMFYEGLITQDQLKEYLNYKYFQ